MTDNNTSRLLKSFVANTIDVYDDATIQRFIVDSRLNTDNLFQHPLTKLNVLYNLVWNEIYGTYATKKDFKDFVTRTLQYSTDIDAQNQIPLNHNTIEKILSHEPFFILRLGVLASKLQSVKDKATQMLVMCNNKHDIVRVMERKWMHRFNVDNTSSVDEPVLRTFIRCSINPSVQAVNITWSSISQYTSVNAGIDDDDMQHMSNMELVQYHMFRDNRFLLQLCTYNVIIGSNLNVHDKVDVRYLIDTLVKETQRQVMFLEIIKNPEELDSGLITTANVYRMHPCILCILPKIASHFTLIVTNKVDLWPRLGVTKQCSSLLAIDNDKDSDFEYTSYASDYGKLFTTALQHANPRKSIYFVPSHKNIDSEASVDIICSIWKQYLSIASCPFKTNNHRMNTMLLTHFIASYLANHISDMKTILQQYKHQDDMKQCSLVIVDSRYNVMSVISSMISFYNVVRHRKNDNINFNLKIYTTEAASKKYIDMLTKMGFSDAYYKIESMVHLDVPLFTIETYNALLKSCDFWKSIGTPTCIIIQDDGMLLNGQDIQDFLGYDYVGAPWVDTQENAYIKQFINAELVGNGGFSVRNTNKMIEICTKYEHEKRQLFFHNINEIPEDVYFVKHLVKDGCRVAPHNVARKFAVEQVVQLKPVGFHKFWPYHSPEVAQTLFEHFLMHGS